LTRSDSHKTLGKIAALALVISLQFPTLLEWHHLFCEHDHSAFDGEASHHMDDEDELCKLSDFQYAFVALAPLVSELGSRDHIFKQYNCNYNSWFASNTHCTKQLRAPPSLA